MGTLNPLFVRPTHRDEADHRPPAWVAWAGLDVILVVLFAEAAKICWEIQPLVLLILPVLFGGLLVFLVTVHDWWVAR